MYESSVQKHSPQKKKRVFKSIELVRNNMHQLNICIFQRELIEHVVNVLACLSSTTTICVFYTR
jgi:hypothetical protein